MQTIDSGWAAIIGAAIGLLGSGLVGVIAPMLLRRQQARIAERTSLAEQRANAIRQFIHACAATLEENDRDGTNRQFSAREVALADLALLVRPGEEAVIETCESALRLITQLDTRLSVKALVEIGKLLPAWHRAEVPAASVLSDFNAAIASQRAEIEAEDAIEE